MLEALQGLGNAIFEYGQNVFVQVGDLLCALIGR